MRVSDTERQRTIDELRRHCAAGRIDVDDYSARLEQAMSATTLEELDQLTTDLPLLRIADPAGYRPGDSGSRAGTAISVAAEEWASAGLTARLSATALVIRTVILVVGAVLLAVLASWAWAAVLVAGWLAGLIQGRITQRRR